MMVPAQWRGIREFGDHVLKHPHKVTDIYTHGFTGFIFTGFEQTKAKTFSICPAETMSHG